jgi:hypothetical protein
MAELKKKDVCLEICPISNRILDNVPDGLATHPLKVLHRAGVPCCLNADDPDALGAANCQGLVREYQVAQDMLGMSTEEIAQLARNSFRYSLAPEVVKQAAFADIDEWLAEQQQMRAIQQLRASYANTVDRTVEEAIRIAAVAPEDHEKFAADYAANKLLRQLPKAHLHLHTGFCTRPCDVKARLGAFNRDPKKLEEAKAKMQAEADTGNKRARAQMPLLEGETLQCPDTFWLPGGGVRVLSLQELDALCPLPGLTGWNEETNLWHGMGAARDFRQLCKTIGIKGSFGGKGVDDGMVKSSKVCFFVMYFLSDPSLFSGSFSFFFFLSILRLFYQSLSFSSCSPHSHLLHICRSVHLLYHTFTKMHGLKGYGGSSMPIAALEAKTVSRRTRGWHGGTCGSQKSSAQKS